jgi:formylglycine-generating enzyme required for sulfatase activity
MANKTCPVCGLEQAETATACGRCGWDFSPMLGTAEQTRALLARRLEEARAAWRQRRYNPELAPEPERDPFETPEEFAARLAERPWYVGEGELQKAGYDIMTGRFPLRFKSSATWFNRWWNAVGSCHLELPREQARALYEERVVWPVYARLGVGDGQAHFHSLVLVTRNGDIPIVMSKPKRLPFEPEMIAIPAGRFLMGSPSDEPERSANEGPPHWVQVPAFELCRYAVTFDDWDACVAAGGCTHRPDDRGWGRGRRPVINVSWDDAQAYVRWLSHVTGKAYRLPSEAEWEYACRAGTATPFSTGRCIRTDQANYDGNRDYAGCGAKTGVYLGKTQPVGSYPANSWGLHDMHGNVWEWVEDCWHDNYEGAPKDGSEWTQASCQTRVLRGGSWYSGPRALRAADRDWSSAGIRHDFLGFRLARTLTP